MKTLVIAEHDNGALKPETSKTINAASKLGFDIDVLIAGLNIGAMSEQVAGIEGVTTVLTADNALYQHQLAENMAELILAIADNYTLSLIHI